MITFKYNHYCMDEFNNKNKRQAKLILLNSKNIKIKKVLKLV